MDEFTAINPTSLDDYISYLYVKKLKPPIRLIPINTLIQSDGTNGGTNNGTGNERKETGNGTNTSTFTESKYISQREILLRLKKKHTTAETKTNVTKSRYISIQEHREALRKVKNRKSDKRKNKKKFEQRPSVTITHTNIYQLLSLDPESDDSYSQDSDGQLELETSLDSKLSNSPSISPSISPINRVSNSPINNPVNSPINKVKSNPELNKSVIDSSPNSYDIVTDEDKFRVRLRNGDKPHSCPLPPAGRKLWGLSQGSGNKDRSRNWNWNRDRRGSGAEGSSSPQTSKLKTNVYTLFSDPLPIITYYRQLHTLYGRDKARYITYQAVCRLAQQFNF